MPETNLVILCPLCTLACSSLGINVPCECNCLKQPAGMHACVQEAAAAVHDLGSRLAALHSGSQICSALPCCRLECHVDRWVHRTSSSWLEGSWACNTSGGRATLCDGTQPLLCGGPTCRLVLSSPCWPFGSPPLSWLQMTARALWTSGWRSSTLSHPKFCECGLDRPLGWLD